jgi:hypothetical protein
MRAGMGAEEVGVAVGVEVEVGAGVGAGVGAEVGAVVGALVGAEVGAAVDALVEHAGGMCAGRYVVLVMATTRSVVDPASHPTNCTVALSRKITGPWEVHGVGVCHTPGCTRGNWSENVTEQNCQ